MWGRFDPPMLFLIYINHSLIRLQLIWIPDNPDTNKKNEKFWSKFSTEYFKKTCGPQEQEEFQTVLRAAGETETAQENKVDEGDPGFQLLTE
jgi:hypothetical protein